MRLIEHQSRTLLAGYGLPFTEAVVVTSPAAAAREARKLGSAVMLKAQVPFGGRALAGGVTSAETPEEAAHQADRLLGMQLRGVTVTQISVERKVSFLREFYAGVAWDTAMKLPVALLGTAGGVDVERSRERMPRRALDPWKGLVAGEGHQLAAEAGLDGKTLDVVGVALERLARAFLESDAVVVEINPLVETADGEILGLDAHVEVDEDAEYRQQARLEPLGAMPPAMAGRPPTPLEIQARRIDATDHRGVAGRVVEFDGNLALLIGGGGASLTIFDAVLKHGGQPANYCEIGGNPTAEKVAALTKLMLSKPGVKNLAVIMNVVNNTRADVIAEGVVAGVEHAGRKAADAISLFRVPGNREDEARAFLASAGVKTCGREVSLDECARRAVEGMEDAP